MNFRRAGLFIVIILLALLAIFNHSAVELVGQKNNSLHSISTNGLQLESSVVLHNPNILSSTIKKIHESFFLNNTVVGTFDQEINQGIPGRKDTELPLNIRFSKSDFPNLFTDSTKQVNLHIEGEIYYQNIISGGTVKVNETSGVAL